MRTEARRKYRCGFVLTEQELRRIHDVADQQMKRTLADVPYITRYELKFQNGAISELTNLDEVFAGENWGSTAVRRVSVDFQHIEAAPKTRIAIKFAHPDDSDADDSISYAIDGEDRDWVFVASSQISERVTRVERFNFQRISSAKLLMPIMMLIILMAMFTWIFTIGSKEFQTRSDTIKQLRQQWGAGTLHDPVDVILRVEEANNRGGGFGNILWIFGLPSVAAIVLLFSVQPILNYTSPAYNFVWGEYQREYEKRRGRGRFVLVGVILTIVLGVLVNFLSKKLGW